MVGSSKTKINPFYIKLFEKWTDLSKIIKYVNKVKHIIPLKGKRLKALCKTNDDFRTTQRDLDENAKKYTTLHPRHRRPKQICMRSLSCYIEFELIVESLKLYVLTVTRAAMLKN